MKHYDLIVIGAGPAGEKAAVKAAYFGKKVAIIERYSEPGGSGVHTGTLPSKTLKETALFLSGKQERGVYGVERRLDKDLTIDDFYFRKNEVTRSEVATINENLGAHLVDVYHGRGSFVDEHTVRVNSDPEVMIAGDFILIATGSYPFHPPHIPFDRQRVHDSNSILLLDRVPDSLVVIGAGVIGCEYTTIFSTMGKKVTLLEGRDSILPFLDSEISGDLVRQMQETGVEVLFNTTVEGVDVPEDAKAPLKVRLAGGKVLETDMLLYAAGRSGRTDALELYRVQIPQTSRGLIEVNENYQTKLPHIYAVGDVIGFPSLASTSMDQGRAAVTHMFQFDGHDKLAHLFPYGIYTVPEVSMVGITEEEAKKRNLTYGIGRAHHAHMPRGKIIGATDGFLKLIFEKPSHKILGVHIIGYLATELVHFGIGVLEAGKTLEDLSSVVFNCPTLHELYKYAAYDGLSDEVGRRLHNA